MKMMPKRLSKSLLVSVLALALVGSVAAAFVWISNIRTTIVSVRPIPITLTGDFIDSPRVSEECLQVFNFTVNDVSNSTGYVWMQFTAPGQTLNIGDIEIESIAVHYPDEMMTYGGYSMPGYPTNTSANQLTFVFGYGGEAPFNFSEISNNGEIRVPITYNVAYTVEASIRITSTQS